MDAQQFITYLKNPRSLDRDSLGGIEELASEFPYCQSLRILHLLNLRMVKHVMYNEQLKTTAAYIADRKRLKELIRELKEESLAPVPAEANQDTTGVIPSPPHEIQIEEDVAAVKDEVADVKEETLIGDALVDEAGAQMADTEPETTQFAPPEEAEPPAEPILPTIEQDEEARLLALREIVENRLREIKQEKEVSKDKEKASKEALINKFIREEPSISRPRAEFFDPVKVARSSQTEHEGLVSETLARIHLQQGNIAKALEIYRRLSLNFPEKSSYFAAQIEKIKSEN